MIYKRKHPVTLTPLLRKQKILRAGKMFFLQSKPQNTDSNLYLKKLKNNKLLLKLILRHIDINNY